MFIAVSKKDRSYIRYLGRRILFALYLKDKTGSKCIHNLQTSAVLPIDSYAAVKYRDMILCI